MLSPRTSLQRPAPKAERVREPPSEMVVVSMHLDDTDDRMTYVHGAAVFTEIDTLHTDQQGKITARAERRSHVAPRPVAQR